MNLFRKVTYKGDSFKLLPHPLSHLVTKLDKAKIEAIIDDEFGAETSYKKIMRGEGP